ncbi:killer cell lectin-like receptor subfamily B member 1B allele A [Xiphophorus hellerii]|uniref:killer cell lectin-like receptor subfamily B member 1B allele A n=1 Tax=Xiphophorus hellerii TaxID=8084 RepID=UPI0013B36B3A|nr:killer cell lectin-like receptor subfamily B member 1B allele A [Xiphophorus hellerii]
MCESYGADLVIVNDETELSFLSGLVGTSSTWIGLYVNHNVYSQALVWVDGSIMAYRPNHFLYYGTSEDSCMYMKLSGYYSSICNQNYGWICEKKLEKMSYLHA